MPEEATQPESPSQTLARSLFGFALLAFLAALLTWVALLFSPVSPDPGFAQLRTLILIAMGLVVLACLILCGWLLRVDLELLANRLEAPVWALQRPWLAIALALLLIWLNLLAARSLYSVAPDFVQPARFLLACWTLISLGILLTINLHGFAGWLKRQQALWTGISLSLLSFVLLLLLALLTDRLVALTGLDDRIRGQLDYRELVFIDDGAAPDPASFWAEQARTRIRWTPYSYWVLESFDGEYINIDSDGLRHTPQPESGPDALRISFFGGSTMWGEGARDVYTIPGHIARLLGDQNSPQQVLNFGQTGYVSTQDLILFQLQLGQDEAPDIAVFYQGFNDILAAYGQGYSGVSLQENARMSDAEAGRLLRAGQPVLRPLNYSLDSLDLSRSGMGAGDAAGIVDRWFDNVALVQALADAHAIETLFVWQPSIIFKQTLSSSEAGIYARTERERSGLFELYAEVDALVRQRVAEGRLPGTDRILILSDLFEADTRPIFHDLVHITEPGNLAVAEAVLPRINTFISQTD